MVALALAENQIRSVMNLLLREEAFDFFELRSFTVQSFARFDIDGAAFTAADGDESAQKAEYCAWAKLRPYAFNIIKGSERPAYLKAVFSMPKEKLAGEFPEAQALFMNILFDKNAVTVTTGASLKKFSLDRTVENAWDSCVEEFLTQNGLKFTRM